MKKNWKIAHSYYKDNVITNMSVLKQGNEYHIDGTVEYMVVVVLVISS